jgi:hypothetical protein
VGKGTVSVPLSVLWDGVSHSRFSAREALREFYEGMRRGLVAATSALNPDNWASTMEPYLQDGKDLLVLSVSSGISAASALFWAPIPAPAYWDCFIWAPAGKQKIIAYTPIDNFPQQ